MGITQLSVDRINRHIKPNSKILILGCQNLYDNENYGKVAHPYFADLGHNVYSWDITGCQGSEVVDLRNDLFLEPEYDFIWQHGTVEHIDGSPYQAFKNIHEACKVGGMMIHENPMTGNWPGHGYHYFTFAFYQRLSEDCRYEIMELEKEAAMGNNIDGWNISVVLTKLEDSKFVAEDKFSRYDLRTQ